MQRCGARPWRRPRAPTRTELGAPAPRFPAERDAQRGAAQAFARARKGGGEGRASGGGARERAERSGSRGRGRGGSAYLDLVPVDGVPAAGAIHLRRAAAAGPVPCPRRRVVAATEERERGGGEKSGGDEERERERNAFGLSARPPRVGHLGLACWEGDPTVPDGGSVTRPGVRFHQSWALLQVFLLIFYPFPYEKKASVWFDSGCLLRSIF